MGLFFEEVGRRVGIEPWQAQQAADAVRAYRYQYQGAEGGWSRGDWGSSTVPGSALSGLPWLTGDEQACVLRDRHPPLSTHRPIDSSAYLPQLILGHVGKAGHRSDIGRER